MSKALIGIATMVMCIGVPARAEWYPVATSSSKSTWYMDPQRMKLVGSKVQAWVLIDSSKDRSVQWSQSKVLMSFNCASGTYRTLSETKYDSYGKVVSSSNVSDYGFDVGYDPVVPETMAEAIEKKACPSE